MTRTFGDFCDQWRASQGKPPRDLSVFAEYEAALCEMVDKRIAERQNPQRLAR